MPPLPLACLAASLLVAISTGTAGGTATEGAEWPHDSPSSSSPSASADVATLRAMGVLDALSESLSMADEARHYVAPRAWQRLIAREGGASSPLDQSLSSLSSSSAFPSPASVIGDCVAFVQTGGCTPDGPVEQRRSCDDVIVQGSSGYCLCSKPSPTSSSAVEEWRGPGFGCSHEALQCRELCALRKGKQSEEGPTADEGEQQAKAEAVILSKFASFRQRSANGAAPPHIVPKKARGGNKEEGGKSGRVAPFPLFNGVLPFDDDEEEEGNGADGSENNDEEAGLLRSHASAHAMRPPAALDMRSVPDFLKAKLKKGGGGTIVEDEGQHKGGDDAVGRAEDPAAYWRRMRRQNGPPRLLREADSAESGEKGPNPNPNVVAEPWGAAGHGLRVQRWALGRGERRKSAGQAKDPAEDGDVNGRQSAANGSRRKLLGLAADAGDEGDAAGGGYIDFGSDEDVGAGEGGDASDLDLAAYPHYAWDADEDDAAADEAAAEAAERRRGTPARERLPLPTLSHSQEANLKALQRLRIREATEQRRRRLSKDGGGGGALFPNTNGGVAVVRPASVLASERIAYEASSRAHAADCFVSVMGARRRQSAVAAAAEAYREERAIRHFYGPLFASEGGGQQQQQQLKGNGEGTVPTPPFPHLASTAEEDALLQRLHEADYALPGREGGDGDGGRGNSEGEGPPIVAELAALRAYLRAERRLLQNAQSRRANASSEELQKKVMDDADGSVVRSFRHSQRYGRLAVASMAPDEASLRAFAAEKMRRKKGDASAAVVAKDIGADVSSVDTSRAMDFAEATAAAVARCRIRRATRMLMSRKSFLLAFIAHGPAAGSGSSSENGAERRARAIGGSEALAVLPDDLAWRDPSTDEELRRVLQLFSKYKLDEAFIGPCGGLGEGGGDADGDVLRHRPHVPLSPSLDGLAAMALDEDMQSLIYGPRR